MGPAGSSVKRASVRDAIPRRVTSNRIRNKSPIPNRADKVDKTMAKSLRNTLPA
jgi:hypothetical protein